MRLSRHPTLVFAVCIGLFLAGGAAVLYGFTTLSYHLPLAATLLPMAAGAALVAASVTLALATERQMRRDEKERGAISPASPPSATKGRSPRRMLAGPPDRVLAQWTLSPDEWRAFNEQEASRKRRGAVQPTLLGAAAGAVVPWVVYGHWQYSVMGAPVAAAVVLAATLLSAARLRTRAPRAGGGVVIRRGRVEIDGVATELSGDGRQLSAVRLRDDLPLPTLEIEVKRTADPRSPARRGPGDRLRIPIPRGREADAARVAELLRGAIPDSADAETASR
jgi:hypothetical protein